MKLTNKVTSLDLSRKLWEAGLTKDMECEYYWAKVKHDKEFHLTKWLSQEQFDKEWEEAGWGIGISSYMDIEIETAIEYYPAPLSVELGEVLPENIAEEFMDLYKCEGKWTIGYDRALNGQYFIDTLPNAIAKMLLYLHKEGLL